MKVQGVAEATADMDAHSVTVTFDDAKTGREPIRKALEGAGFSVLGEPVKVVPAAPQEATPVPTLP